MDRSELLRLVMGDGFAPEPAVRPDGTPSLLAAPAPLPGTALPPPRPPPATSSSRRRSIDVSVPVGLSDRFTPERLALVSNPIAREFLGKKYAPSAPPEVGHGPLPSPEDAELQDAQSLSAAMQAANTISRAAAGFTQSVTGAQMDGELYRGLERGAAAPVQNLLQRRGEARDAADYARRAEHQGLQMAQGQQGLKMGAVQYDKAVRDMTQLTEEDKPESDVSKRAAEIIARDLNYPRAIGMSFTALMKMSPLFRAKLERDESLARIRASEASAESARALSRERMGLQRERMTADQRKWLAGKIPKNAISMQRSLDELDTMIRSGFIPDVGFVEGGIPAILKSPQGQRIFQKSMNAYNNYILEMAGKAVTGPEAARMKQALGMIGPGADEAMFLNGMDELRDAHESAILKLVPGVSREIAREYLNNTGLGVQGHGAYSRQPGTLGSTQGGRPTTPGAAPAQAPPGAAPRAAQPPARTPVSRTPSKDGKWLRLNYADGTSEVVPNG